MLPCKFCMAVPFVLNPMTNKKTKVYTTSIARANLFALIITIPVAAIFATPYLMLWPLATLADSLDNILIKFIPALILGTIIHELIHGITWAIYASKGWRSIKFGMKWTLLTPYCHCKEPLKKSHYLLGAIMPLILMGIIPGLTGIATGNPYLLLFGIFFTWAAAGDILGAWMLRKVEQTEWVADHPDKLGFVVLDKK